MKHRILALAFVILASLTIGWGMEGTEYGKKLTLATATKISEILAAPEQYNGKRVLVSGPITGVCEMRGCWIAIGSDKESGSLTFKVDDGVIVFPMDAMGKNVKAEGVVEVKTVTVEDQITEGKHHAEETGETFDPATVTAPKVSVRILGEGAVID